MKENSEVHLVVLHPSAALATKFRNQLWQSSLSSFSAAGCVVQRVIEFCIDKLHVGEVVSVLLVIYVNWIPLTDLNVQKSLHNETMLVLFISIK